MLTLIIDGNNIAMRAFHTPQGDLRSKRGEPTGVTMGVLTSLKGYLDRFPEANQCYIVWDYGKAKWRMELHPDYKMNRAQHQVDRTEEDIQKFQDFKKQTTELHNFFHNLAIHSVRFGGWEADDIIYALACMIPGQKVLITTDKDMYQLINPEVSIYNLYRDVVMTPNNFEQVTGGISLKSWMGYRALLGDKSDNIPGVPGIGEVTAKNLMTKYGHIDEMFKDKTNLMKSKRTARIFEPESLQAIGRNNKMMSFGYVDYSEIKDALTEEIGKELSVNSSEVKKFLMSKEFIQIMSNYIGFISPFNALGVD